MPDFQPTIGDQAVKARTGKDWQEWFDLLDSIGAQKMSHPQIVAYIQEHYPIDLWWQQSVTVNYELARGLRTRHENPQGFQVSRSKTFPVPVERLFAAWQDEAQRFRWLPVEGMLIRKATPSKSLRITWVDGQTDVDVNLYEKGAGKGQVTVQHSRLDTAERAEDMKAYWSAALERLEEFLKG